MGVKDKVRTDLDLHKEPILGMGMYAIERSYPKVGVGQMWKQYLKQLKNYAHIWKTLCWRGRRRGYRRRQTPIPTPGW